MDTPALFSIPLRHCRRAGRIGVIKVKGGRGGGYLVDSRKGAGLGFRGGSCLEVGFEAPKRLLCFDLLLLSVVKSILLFDIFHFLEHVILQSKYLLFFRTCYLTKYFEIKEG